MRGKSLDDAASDENFVCSIPGFELCLIHNGILDAFMKLFKINVEITLRVSGRKRFRRISTKNIAPSKLCVYLRVVWVDLGLKVTIDILLYKPMISHSRPVDNCRVISFVIVLFATVDV